MPLHGQEKNLYSEFPPDFQRIRNPLEHDERMPLVIGIFQPATRRSRCPHTQGQFPLAQSRLRPQPENLARNFGTQSSPSILSASLSPYPHHVQLGAGNFCFSSSRTHELRSKGSRRNAIHGRC